MEHLKNEYCNFKVLMGDVIKKKNLFVITLFKVKSRFNRKKFEKYVNGILILSDILKTFNNTLPNDDKFTLRLYIDKEIYDDKLIYDKLIKLENISIIMFNCMKYKSKDENYKYHFGLFGTLVRFFPLFDFENNDAKHIIVLDADTNEKIIYRMIYGYLLLIKHNIINDITLYYGGREYYYEIGVTREDQMPLTKDKYGNILPYLIANNFIILKTINCEIFCNFLNEVEAVTKKEHNMKNNILLTTYISIVKNNNRLCEQNICFGIDEYFLNVYYIPYLIKHDKIICIYKKYDLLMLLLILKLQYRDNNINTENKKK